MDNTYDVIVIGSGIGGMTAAGLLAGVDKKKVLVLEKHTEPGGLTHVFRRDGASWDVGVHYIGELAPKSRLHNFFNYLSGGALRWNPLPDQFERFVYPGIDIRVPSNKAEYRRILIEQFPKEARAIRRYFADIRRTALWDRLNFMRSMVPRPVEPMIRWIQQRTNRTALLTTGAYLARRFRSPALRAVAASQWGDYGLPPSLSAFAIHAQIVYHYFKGAWFPEGGSARIARTFEKGIERMGGSIYVAQDAQEILIEDGKPVGVRVVDRRGLKPVERIYKAPVIISNVGAYNTYEKLLPTGGEVGAKTALVRGLVRRLNNGLSAVTLYLRLKADPRTIGIQGENHWINTTFDHDDIPGQTRGTLEGNPSIIYVSFPSIKAKEEYFHTAEIIAPIDSDAFDRWANTPKGNRGAEYTELKRHIGDGLLKLADAHIPGLAKLVTYSELSTPLTHEHYISQPRGRYNGAMAAPERYRAMLLGPRTPIEGIYLAGADAGCLGIMGALMGGVGAACQAMGAKGFPMIMAALRKGPVPASDADPLPEQKRRAKLVAKRALTPNIWHMEFQIDGKVGGYAPGQFARVHVGSREWRDYSIVGLDGKTVAFLISTHTGGDGAQFVQNAAIGTTTEIELPLGQYTLTKSGRRQVFVATGTGLAPFVPMFRALQKEGALSDAVLFFGCRTAGENITPECKPLPGKVVCCVSREKPPAGGHRGRVSTALAAFKFDPEATDFYLCGSSAMVADCTELLQKRGAKYLFTESY